MSNVVPPITFCNASQRELYVPPTWAHVRAGAGQLRQLELFSALFAQTGQAQLTQAKASVRWAQQRKVRTRVLPIQPEPSPAPGAVTPNPPRPIPLSFSERVARIAHMLLEMHGTATGEQIVAACKLHGVQTASGDDRGFGGALSVLVRGDSPIYRVSFGTEIRMRGNRTGGGSLYGLRRDQHLHPRGAQYGQQHGNTTTRQGV